MTRRGLNDEQPCFFNQYLNIFMYFSLSELIFWVLFVYFTSFSGRREKITGFLNYIMLDI